MGEAGGSEQGWWKERPDAHFLSIHCPRDSLTMRSKGQAKGI